MPYLNEVTICAQEGAATVSQIDAALGPGGFGWPMGPFVLMDMLGLDVCHHILAYLDAAYGERLEEALLLRTLVEGGRLGKKGKGGFYDYPDPAPSTAVDQLIRELLASGRISHPNSTFSVERTVLALVNEAFLCLEEGVASAGDIDRGCVMGLGMAVRQRADRVPMGPLAYAEHIGLRQVLDRLSDLERTLGRRFRPAPILELKAAEQSRRTSRGAGIEEAG
jgi:3-hydroxyacyl-CoA dehydrogenase/enoyl-CoA hydratase/3-hydroxybutyryl-CoA epimerase